jgi:hypothetical protein
MRGAEIAQRSVCTGIVNNVDICHGLAVLHHSGEELTEKMFSVPVEYGYSCALH